MGTQLAGAGVVNRPMRQMGNRIAQATAILAVMIGVGVAAFWFPTRDYQDVFTGMMIGPSGEAPALHALARRECGLRLPIQRIGVVGDLGWRWINCRAPFGVYTGTIWMSGSGITDRTLDPNRGTIAWLVLLLLEGSGVLLLYRILRPRPT